MSIIQIDENAIRQLEVTTYGEVTKLTETLSKCRLRIFYKGLNRNRTFISEDFANQLIASLPYAPVKGIFNYGKVDFEDHGEENTDGRIYGIVPEKINFAWEDHEDTDGVTRKYACCDVILYTSLYPEANLISGKAQSMEIYPKTMQGEWKTWEDGKPYFHFYKGELFGLQILGNDVEPCFEGAAFFSLYKDVQEMANYIKNYTKEQEEKKKMAFDKNQFRLSDNAKFDMLWDSLNPNFSETGEIDNHIVDIYDDYVICYSCKKKKYIRVYYTKDNAADTVTLGDVVDVYIMDVTEVEKNALEAMKTLGGGTYEKVEENYNAKVAEVETANAKIAEYETVKATMETKYTELETAKTALETEIADVKGQLEAATNSNSTYAIKVGELTSENVRLTNELSNINNENQNLAAFKAQIESDQKNGMLAEFSAKLTKEQIDEYTAKMGEMSVDEFKAKLCVAAYDSEKANFSANPQSMIHKLESTKVVEEGALGILNKYFSNGGNQ